MVLSAYQEGSAASAGKVSYTGTWASHSLSAYYGGSVRHASVGGRAASCRFMGGRQVAWVAPKGPNRGYAYVYVDGVRTTTVNLYSATAQYRSIIYAKGGLDPSIPHTLRVYVTGSRPQSSNGTRVDVDAFVVLR